MKDIEEICRDEMESRGMMEETVSVELTRRELYWIRANSLKRMEAAMQGMSAVNARPAKRSERREEYLFHQALVDRLCGLEPEEEEVKALRELERANRLLKIQRRAEMLRMRADELMQEAREGIVNQ